jgi:hypothetical protein
MIRFLRSLTGQIVILLLLAAFVGWSVYGRFQAQARVAVEPKTQPLSPKVNPLKQGPTGTPGGPGAIAPPVEGLASMALRTGGSIARLIVPDSIPDSEVQLEATIPKQVREQMLAAPEPLTLFFSTVPTPAGAPLPPTEFAPYGRMIRCKLVTGLESSNLTTPLVALTTEDLWHRGPDGISRLIIPAGVEVHGPAATHGRLRDRLEASGAYMFVWRTSDANNGRELGLHGIALTRDVNPDTGGVRPDDGTGGIRGDLIESASNTELKLFAAAFLQAAATGALQTDRQINPLTNRTTSTLKPTLRNSGVVGTQAVLDEFAARIRLQLQEEGHYVAVPAGREFYIYIPETIDLRKATRGGLAQTNLTRSEHVEVSN